MEHQLSPSGMQWIHLTATPEICFTTMQTNWWVWALKSAGGLFNVLLQTNTCRVPNSLFFFYGVDSFWKPLTIIKHELVWIFAYILWKALVFTKCLVLMYKAEKIFNFTWCLEKWNINAEENIKIEMRTSLSQSMFFFPRAWRRFPSVW